MTKTALEVVEFKLNNNVTEEDFLLEVDKTKPFITSLEGFLSRKLAKKDDGSWIDIVEWESMSFAEKAAQKFQEAEEVKAFCMMIAPDTINMQHFNAENKM